VLQALHRLLRAALDFATMGCVDSKVAELLGQMGWDRRPELAVDMENDALKEYLGDFKLEVVLPRHAPQLDLSIGDRKQAMYPRPAFIHEGYKMHLAFIGPSTACKKQFVDFLPKMAHVFQGPPVKIAPGRVARDGSLGAAGNHVQAEC